MKCNQTSSDDKCVSAHPAVLCRPLADGLLLLHLDKKSYFSLDRVGTTFWQTAIKAQSLTEACHLLSESYDVEFSVIANDFRCFVERLVKLDLAEIIVDQANSQN